MQLVLPKGKVGTHLCLPVALFLGAAIPEAPRF